MGIPEIEDFGPLCSGIIWTLFGITVIFVALRVYCRMSFGTRKLGTDDYITLLTVFLFLLSLIFYAVGVSWGLGKHITTLTAEEVKNSIFYSTVCCSICIWVFSLPKLAIVALLQRLLNLGLRTAITFWTMAAIGQIGIFLTSIFWFKQCEPVAYQWDTSLDGSCPYRPVANALAYSTSSYSAFLDLFFALYPIPALMRLNMPLRNRIIISIAMGLTSFGSIVSIYKVVQLTEGFPILSSDPTYPMPYLYMLVYIEAAILIIFASVPALGPIFRTLNRKFASSASKGSEGNSNRGTRGQTLITIGGSNWRQPNKFKGGHRIRERADIDLDHDIEDKPIDPSLDDIPLAPITSQSPSSEEILHEQKKMGGIRKTVNVAFSSESLDADDAQKHRLGLGDISV